MSTQKTVNDLAYKCENIIKHIAPLIINEFSKLTQE